MAKKKSRFPIPTANEIWRAGFILLQHALRVEKNKLAVENDEVARRTLWKICQLTRGFLESREIEFQRGMQAQAVSQLADVYRRVVKGSIRNRVEYEREIVKGIGELLVWDAGCPENPIVVPGLLIQNKKTIIEEGGPIEAATNSIAQLRFRGARQIFKDRSRIKAGVMKFDPLDREREGLYHLSDDFYKFVMLKTLSIRADLVNEIMLFLRKKHLAEVKDKIGKRGEEA